MGGNETVTAPTPTIDLHDGMTAIMQVTEGPGLVYSRADGTVERAIDRQDAINRCPYLGKLALESPEKVNILLELAEASNENTQLKVQGSVEPGADAKQEITQKPVKADKTNRPTVEPRQEIATTERQVFTATERPAEAVKLEKKGQSIPDAIIQHDLLRQQARQRELVGAKALTDSSPHSTIAVGVTEKVKTAQRRANVVAPNKIETTAAPDTRRYEIVARTEPTDNEVLQRQKPEAKTLNHLKVDRQAVKKHDSTSKKTGGSAAPETVAVKAAIPDVERDDILEIAEPSETTEAVTEALEPVIDKVVVPPAVESYDAGQIAPEPPEMTDASSDVLDIEAIMARIEAAYRYKNIEGDELDEDLQLTADDEAVVDVVIQEAEGNEAEWLELLFEPETIDTYLELTALIDNVETSQLALAEGLEIADNTSTLPRANIEIADIPDLETFMATRGVSEEPMTLEAIQERADEQPVEQTLIQLVEYLTEAAEVLEQKALLRIVQEIEKALPACYGTQETVDVKPRITPKMTEKILMLLHGLGCQKPKDALVSFVAKYDIALLLQTLDYICQLSNNENRREFLVALAVTTNTDDDDNRQRLGKAIIGMVIKYALEPMTYLSRATSGFTLES